MKNILVLVLVVFASRCEAQTTFFKTYGSTNKEEGKCLALCADNGFIIGADITLIPPAPDSSNILIVKTNSMGDTLWTRIINSGENDFCVKVIETSDLGYVVLANRVNSGNNSKIVLIRLNSSGVIQWQKTFLKGGYGFTGHSLIEKMQGGYLICGAKVDTSLDGILINTNPAGDTLWTKNYWQGTSAFIISFRDVTQLADFSYVLLGVNNNINIYEPRMLRIDTLGNLMYEHGYCYGFCLDDGFMTTFAKMRENNKYVIGGLGGVYQPTTSSFLLCVDSAFNIQWAQKVIMPFLEISNVVQMQDSGFIFLAEPYNQPIYHHCLMVKTNSTGIVSWAKDFQYGSVRSPQSLSLTSDNGIAFCGFFMDTISTHNKDLLLLKTDANGNIPCDGITASIVNSAISFNTYTNTYNISSGLFMTASTLNSQGGGIPYNNVCFTTSESENYSELNSELKIFPNPTDASAVLIVNFFEKKNATLQLLDVNNKVLYEERVVRDKTTLTISSFASGVYWYRIISDDGEFLGAGKLLVVH